MNQVWYVIFHLDDDQTELALQEEKEALADAVGCVSRLEQVYETVVSEWIELN